MNKEYLIFAWFIVLIISFVTILVLVKMDFVGFIILVIVALVAGQNGAQLIRGDTSDD